MRAQKRRKERKKERNSCLKSTIEGQPKQWLGQLRRPFSLWLSLSLSSSILIGEKPSSFEQLTVWMDRGMICVFRRYLARICTYLFYMKNITYDALVFASNPIYIASPFAIGVCARSMVQSHKNPTWQDFGTHGSLLYGHTYMSRSSLFANYYKVICSQIVKLDEEKKKSYTHETR